MMYRLRRLGLPCLMFCIALSTAAFGRDRTQVGSNINVGPNEQVGDATCFGCSILVRGQVSGDVTAFGGSVVIEDQGQVGGDITTFGGGVRLDNEANVRRAVPCFGWRIQREQTDIVGGSV